MSAIGVTVRLITEPATDPDATTGPFAQLTLYALALST
jgi:hypothetical protein